MSKREYDHQTIEQKWQQVWADQQTYQTIKPSKQHPKRYLLSMFPYPSGDGLHVGHVEGYTGTDVLARYYRMNGDAVFHPMGWDAFGLPAENYAVKKGIHPQETTTKNIERYKQQLISMGFSYDWNNEINTSSPDYYRWTQWIFLKLYEAGLAYQKEAPVNWCPSCQTVLANEQVISGQCERCGTEVGQKKMKQWFFKITDYAEDLLSGLDNLKWPESIKTAQRNWIGKSEGTKLKFAIENSQEQLDVFTTRVDTLAGATYVVLAPEHPLVSEITTTEQRSAVNEYQEAAKKKSELDRLHLEKDKTGVFTGAQAVNPLNGQLLPIWVADYVVMSYGTGAIMAVPAHDERDFDFAKKYNLPIIEVIKTGETKANQATTIYGTLINSGDYDGLTSEEAKEKITADLAVKGLAEPETNYRLRDWLISRQRYWGAPIPIIYCDQCGAVPVPETDLPVLLPNDVDFKPHGHSPLADSPSFNQVSCPKCGQPAKRETDTMDTFVCSSWYYLRYSSAHDDSQAFSSDSVKTWLPVDCYIGGAEHAVLHLLYARFFTKFFKDQKLLNFNEPFLELHNVGVILGPDHQKMSKSKGNVVNPDEVVQEYGADVLRLHELFLGPFSDEKPWSVETIKGSRRFVESVYEIGCRVAQEQTNSDEAAKTAIANAVRKVTTDTPILHFNTAIAAMMTAVNVLRGARIAVADWQQFLLILAPYTPHLVSELWSLCDSKNEVHLQGWPNVDSAQEQPSLVNLVVQINGRVRATFQVTANETEAKLTELALAQENIKRHLNGRSPAKVIVVPNKVVNFIVTD